MATWHQQIAPWPLDVCSDLLLQAIDACPSPRPPDIDGNLLLLTSPPPSRSASRSHDAYLVPSPWPPNIDGNLLILPSASLSICFPVTRRMSVATAVATRHRRQSASPALAISLTICSLVRLYTWHDKSRVSDAQKIALIVSIIVCSDCSSNERFNLYMN